MITPRLNAILSKLRAIFEQPDRRLAHQQAGTWMRQMADDREILYEIVRKNLAAPGFLQKNRINPVIAMEIDKTPNYELIMHGWLPRPDRSVDFTHQSIHHHGQMLLTSVSPFGPGYDSILFQPGYSLDSGNGSAELKPEKFYRNGLHNLEFVDTQTPHVVFFPPEVSVTYALWSAEKPSVVDGLKNLKVVQKYRKQARSLLESLGLSKAAGLKKVEYFDFCLEDGCLLGMKDRVRYPEGTHSNFAENLFFFLQQVQFPDIEFVTRLPDVSADVVRVKNQFLRGQPISDSFEQTHLHVPRVTLSRPALLEHFGLREL